MRIKQNSKIISNVTYHGDLEKKALMEQKRNLSGEGDGDIKNKNGVPARSPSYMDEISSVPTSSHPPPPPPGNSHQNYNSPSHTSYNRGNNHDSGQGYSNSRSYQPAPQQAQHHVNSVPQHRDPYQQPMSHQQPPTQYAPPPQPQAQQQYNSPYSSRGQQNVIYTSDGGPGKC